MQAASISSGIAWMMGHISATIPRTRISYENLRVKGAPQSVCRSMLLPHASAWHIFVHGARQKLSAGGGRRRERSRQYLAVITAGNLDD